MDYLLLWKGKSIRIRIHLVNTKISLAIFGICDLENVEMLITYFFRIRTDVFLGDHCKS